MKFGITSIPSLRDMDLFSSLSFDREFTDLVRNIFGKLSELRWMHDTIGRNKFFMKLVSYGIQLFSCK